MGAKLKNHPEVKDALWRLQDEKLRCMSVGAYVHTAAKTRYKFTFTASVADVDRWLKGKPLDNDRSKMLENILNELLAKSGEKPEIIYRNKGQSASNRPHDNSQNTLDRIFDDSIEKIKQIFKSGEWVKARTDPNHPDHTVSDLKVSVADSQEHGKKLIDAVVDVMREASRRYREFPDALETLVFALGVLDEIDLEHQKAKRLFKRTQFIDKIKVEVSIDHVYLLFLYYTYLKEAEPKNPLMIEAKALFNKNHLFSLLKNYRNRINYNLYEIHEPTLFARPGEEFRNYYWQPHTVRSGETIESIVQIDWYYDKSDRDTAIQGIIYWLGVTYELFSVPPDKPLLPILKKKGLTNILVVPPKKQMDAYDPEVSGFPSGSRVPELTKRKLRFRNE